MKNILIRKANLEDTMGIAQVHVHSWQATYRGQIPDEILDNLHRKASQRVAHLLQKKSESLGD